MTAARTVRATFGLMAISNKTL